MMRAAFVPSTPLLVPEVAVDTSDDLDDMRSASLAATRELTESGAGGMTVVAAGPTTRCVEGPLQGSLRGFGVDVTVRTGGDGELHEVAWAPTLGMWLLDQVGWTGAVTVVEVGPSVDDGAAAAACIGQRIGDSDALLVVGDGSAGLTVKSPGYLVDGASDFDDMTCAALGSADLEALASLDRVEAQRVMSGGVAVWLAVANALSDRVGNAPITASLTHRSAPHGVGYAVALWDS